MAIDKRLQVFDAEGNPVDYDILATDVKFNDGEDLPTKLAELEEEIGEGGYNPPEGGIPATDLAPAVQTSLGKADSAYQKPASGIPASDIASGVIPDVSGFATKTEVNTGLASKANDNAVVKSISVNGGNAQTPQNGNVNIQVQGAAGITPHIGSNGHWWLGDENDSENDTGVNAQGPAGTSYTSADLTIGNALNGQGDVLGMAGAMMIKNNIDSLATSLNRLYACLANMAFWDSQDKASAQPTPLDWSVPKKTVTLDLSGVGSHITVKHGVVPVVDGDTIEVDEGSNLVLNFYADTDYALSALSTSTSGATANLQAGTVALENVTANTTLVISASAAGAYGITYNLTGCAAPAGVTNPTSIMQGGGATIYLESTNGFDMPASLPSGAVTGATANYTRDSQDATLATIVLSNATGNVVVAVSASMPELVLGKFVDIMANTRCYIHTNNTRACLLVARTDVSNPSTWLAGAGATGEDTDAEAAYSTIPIPAGATKVSMDCNSSFTYGLTLVDNGTTPQNTVEWTTGGTKKELLLADYPNAAYIIVNLKKNNNSAFTNETYASMGIDLQIS